MFPERIKKLIAEPIPENIIKQKKDDNSSKKLSYISGSTVIGILNYVFDYDWDFQILKFWIEESVDYIVKSSDGKPSKVIPQPPVANAHIRLTVRYLDEKNELCSVSKEGLGSKVIIGTATKQQDNFKAAATDALKKAASCLGIGLQLYYSDEEMDFFESLGLEDCWTDALRTKYAKCFKSLDKFKASVESDPDVESYTEVLNNYIASFTDYKYRTWRAITPDNIEDFISFLKSNT